MANYCENEIFVTTKVPISDWTLEGRCGDRVLSFEKILPCPVSDETVSRQWKIDNWGRESDLAYVLADNSYTNYDLYYEMIDNGIHQFSILTQWGVPRRYFEALAEFLGDKDENFGIVVNYEDSGNSFLGKITVAYDDTKKKIRMSEVSVDGIPPSDLNGNYVFVNEGDYDLTTLRSLGKNVVPFSEWIKDGRLDEEEKEDMKSILGIEDEAV